MRLLKDIRDWLALRVHVEDAWGFLRTRRRELGSPLLTVTLRDGASLTLRGGTDDRQILLDVFGRDVYGLNGLAPGSLGTVIDIGAHVGLFAARASPLAKRVLAYEPTPDNFELHLRNTAHLANVWAHRQAVAGRSGLVRLYTRSHPSNNAIVLTDEPGDPSGSLTVEATILEDIFAEHKVERCDFLKMDCEGAEYQIVYGAAPELWARINRVAMEYYPVRGAPEGWSGEGLAGYLSTLGHRATLRPRSKHPRKGMLSAVRG